jgi:hypothetical protein
MKCSSIRLCVAIFVGLHSPLFVDVEVNGQATAPARAKIDDVIDLQHDEMGGIPPLPSYLSPDHELFLYFRRITEVGGVQSAFLYASPARPAGACPVEQLSYPPLVLGSTIPLRGKLFRVAGMKVNRQATHFEMKLTAVRDAELEARISTNDDTFCFSFRREAVQVRGIRMNITAETSAGDAAAKSLKANFQMRSQNLRGPDIAQLTDDQREQMLGIGEVIRFGKYGLKIRNIVLPSDAEKIPGWVEVFQKEIDLSAEK